jgi:hypothetical protein
MTNKIASPFFDLDDPDPRYLNQLSKWHWPYTCRCKKRHGWTLDYIRGMWVCPDCRLPNGYTIEFCASDYAKECFGCGNLFVVWDTKKEAAFCNKCGGDNAAKPGQRTQVILTSPIPETHVEGLD